MMFRLRCIGFIFLIATVPLLGCPDNKGENMFNIEEKIKDIEEKMKEKMLVGRLDAVLLTVDDLPTMELDGGMARRIDGIAKQPPGCRQVSPIMGWNSTRRTYLCSILVISERRRYPKSRQPLVPVPWSSSFLSTRTQCRGCHRRCHMAHPRCLIPLVREKQCLGLHHGQQPLTQSTDVDEIRRPKG